MTRRDEAQFVDDQQVHPGQLALQVEQRFLSPGLQWSTLPHFDRRDLPCAVTQPVYFATMVLLDRRADCIVAESVEPARASLPPWLETALFTAPAGNPCHLQLRWWLENPVYFCPGRTVYFCHSSQGAAG